MARRSTITGSMFRRGLPPLHPFSTPSPFLGQSGMARGGGQIMHESSQINRSTFNKWILENLETKTTAPLLARFFPFVILEHILVHTKAPWHEETNSKRHCCCTREGPRCEVARWSVDHARGVGCPGDQARCELLYTAENLRKAAALFLCLFLLS